MAENLGTIFAKLGLDTKEWDSKMKKTGKNLKKLGKSLSMGLTAPLVALGIVAVKTGADFETSITNAAVVAGETGEQFEKMKNIAREMGKTTKFSAKEAADGMYFMACLPPDELIITGDYKVEQIGKFRGNSVIGKDGEVQKVLKHTYRPCTEKEVIKIKPLMQRPFRVTANHPIYAISGKPCRPSNVSGNSNSPSLCKPTCNKKEETTCTKKYYEKYKPEWIEAGKLKQGDILLIPRIKKSEEVLIDWDLLKVNVEYSRKRYGKKLPKKLDEKFAYFLGLMLGDGWADKERIGCVFNAEKDVESLEWFENYLKELGYSSNRRKTPGAIQVLCWSRPLAKLINKWIGKGAENKRIPPGLFKAKEGIIYSFLRGYIDSDGYVDFEKGIIGISTISKNIAYTINYLAAKCGMVFSIGKTEGRKSVAMPSGSKSDLKPLYTISTVNPKYIGSIYGIRPQNSLKFQKHWLDDDFIYLPIYSIKKEKYEGFVYNLETKDNTYSTGVIVHNSAGWDVDKMGKAIKPTLDLASATNSDLAFTTETVVSALNQFGLASSEATRVADVYAAAISGSQATLERLNISMGYLGATAHALDFNIEDTSAALMVLFDRGIKASMAGTGLRQALAKLMDPTKKMTNALNAIGLSVADVNPEMNSMRDIVANLENAGMGASDAFKIFGQRAGPAMLNLVSAGAEGIDNYRKKLDESGKAASMAERQLKTLAGIWTILKSAASEVAIQFGEIIIPVLKNLIENHLKPMVEWLSNLSKGWKTLVIIIGTALAALGPLLLILGQIVFILPSVATGVAAIGVAVKFALGPLGLLGIAAFAAYLALKKVAKVEREVAEAAAESHAAVERQRNDLIAVAAAAGMTGMEFARLEQAYKGNTTALVRAIQKGKHGVKIQEALFESGKKGKKAYEEWKGATDDASDATDDFSAAMEEFNKLVFESEQASIAAKTAADLWDEKMDKMGIMTIPQTAKTVRELNEDLEHLRELLISGKIDLENYAKGAETIEEKLKELTSGHVISDLDTELGDLGDHTNELSDIFVKLGLTLPENVGKPLKNLEDQLRLGMITWEEYQAAMGNTLDVMDTRWGDVISGMSGAFGQFVFDVLSDNSTFMEDIKAGLEGLKNVAKNIFADMAQEYIENFLKKIVTSGVTAFADVGKDIADLGKSVAGSITSIGSIATAALTGVGAAIGTFLGGLIGKKTTGWQKEMQKQGLEQVDFLHNIRDLTKNDVMAALKSLEKQSWRRGDQLTEMVFQSRDQSRLLGSVEKKFDAMIGLAKHLPDIAINTALIAKELKNMGGLAEGGIQMTPTIKKVAETGPEIYLPLQKLGDFMKSVGGGSGKQGNITLVNKITMEPAVLRQDENWLINFIQKKADLEQLLIPERAVR